MDNKLGQNGWLPQGNERWVANNDGEVFANQQKKYFQRYE